MSDEKEISEAFRNEISDYRPKKKKRRIWHDDIDSSDNSEEISAKEKTVIKEEVIQKVTREPIVEKPKEVVVEPKTELESIPLVSKETKSEEKGSKGKYYALYNYNDKIESLKSGFTMLPNSMMLEMLEKRVSPGGMRALLLIARLSIGYQKDRAYISKSIFAEFLPTMSKSKLNKELRVLEEKGFIKIQQGDRTSTSCYIVESKYHTKSLRGISTKSEAPKKKETVSKKTGSLGSLIDLKLAPGKIEDEKKSIGSLTERYSESEIIDAHKFILAYGALKSGEPVRAPFTYLRKAIDDVLLNVEKQKIKEKHINARKEAHHKKQELEVKLKEDSEKDRIRKESLNRSLDEKLNNKFNEAELMTKLDSTVESLMKKNQYLKSMPSNMINKTAKIELGFNEGLLSLEEYNSLQSIK